MYDLRVSVVEVRGFCDLPMRIGDYFEVSGGRIYVPPSGYICMWALNSIMPMLPAKQRRIQEENDWIPHTEHMSCPDPNGMVIFRVERLPGIAPLRAGSSGAVDSPSPVEPTTLPPARMLVRGADCDSCGACAVECIEACGTARIEPAGVGVDPRVCRQCGNAPCVAACPEGALGRDVSTGAVTWDGDLCKRCWTCSSACPFEAVLGEECGDSPRICDLCGGEPRCVEVCPRGVLSFGRPTAP